MIAAETGRTSARTSARISTGCTSGQWRTRGRTPAAPRTRPASTCVPSSPWAWEQELIDAPVPEAVAVAGRGQATLPDQARTQRPVFRDVPDAAAARVGCPASGRAVLAERLGRVLQLRGRYRDRLEVGPAHDPILWRHVSWDQWSPDQEVKELSRWGWLFYRRVKTDKVFYRPMSRAVHVHLRAITRPTRYPTHPSSLAAVFAQTLGSKSCARSQASRRGRVPRSASPSRGN